MYSCQTHFDFTNLVSEVHRFKVVAISLHKKWSWTPCTSLRLSCRWLKLISFKTFFHGKQDMFFVQGKDLLIGLKL